MRIFILATATAVVVAVIGAYALDALQKSVASAYIGDSVRFNQQEQVNDYGREG
jgi:hypothetical protein